MSSISSDTVRSKPNEPLSDRTPTTITTGYYLVRAASRWLCIVMGGYHDHGREYIPKTGAAIIATNHLSIVDPPLVAWCTNRPMRSMAKKELFENPIMRAFWKHLGAFPVTRGAADRNAIRKALGILENGEILLFFPEGHRGDGITLGEAQKGMAMIALKAKVPIIPAYIEGTDKLLPRGGVFPRRATVYVRFGPPIDTTPFQDKGGIDKLGPAVMARIAELREDQCAALDAG